MSEELRNRRTRGEGAIFQKVIAIRDGKKILSNLWTIQFWGPGPSGKRIRYRESTGVTSRSKAQKLLTKRLNEVNVGEFHPEVRRRPVLVSELYEALEQDYRISHRIPETVKTVPITRRWRHLEPVFAKLPAVSVSAEHIVNYKEARQLEGAANATINRELSCLRRVFTLEMEKEKASRIDRIPLIKELDESNNVRQGFVGQSGYDQLVAEAKEPWLRLLLELAWTFGWRRNEMLRLRVKQVDFEKRVIRLNPGTTKNKRGRQVPMTTKVEELLRFACARKRPDDYVLTRPDEKGHPQPICDIRDAWHNLCIRSGLGKLVCRRCGELWRPRKRCKCGGRQAKYQGLILHDLRRSAAREYRAAGVPESVIMRMAGWLTRAMFERYNIVNDDDQVKAIAQREDVRRNASAPVRPPQASSEGAERSDLRIGKAN